MKLIVCVKCSDIVLLRVKEERKCSCGLSKGNYRVDGLLADYDGPCIPIGFSNPSLIEALRNQPESGMGKLFEAFVIPKSCPTMFKKDAPYEIEKK